MGNGLNERPSKAKRGKELATLKKGKVADR
jgi:hypothetical protein